MGATYSEKGGGAATGLSNDFIKFLQGGLNTGSFGSASATQRLNGSDPVGATGSIAGILNDILAGGAGKLGGNMSQMIEKDVNNQADAVRARFGASGGTAFGTPAAYAEAQVRSQAAPQITQAIGGLQLSALQQLLPIFANLSGKGIAQREGVYQQNPWVTALQGIAPIAGTAAGLMRPNPLGSEQLGSVPNINSSAFNINVPSAGAVFDSSRYATPWWANR